MTPWTVAVAPIAKHRALIALRRGFTMIELLIVIAIGAILAAVAVPSLRATLNNTRQNSALGLVINDLNQARGEAIKRNSRVLMCVRNAAGTDCAAGTDWRAGWVVCIDADSDNACDTTTVPVANPNPVVVVRPPLDPALTLNASAAVIRFNANSSAVAATLTLGGATSRIVTVAGTGNISKQ